MRDEGAIPGNGAASVPSYRFASPGWAVAALLAGLLLTAVFGWREWISERERVQLLQRSLADAVPQRLREPLEGTAQALRSMQTVFLSSNLPVDQPAFADYQHNLRAQEWLSGYVLTAFASRQPVPGTGREVYRYVFVAPLQGSEALLGFDIAGQPENMNALLRARDADMPAMSAPFQLLQFHDSPGQAGRGVTVRLPAYGPGPLPATQTERRAREIGALAISLRLEPMVLDALKGRILDHMHVDIRDMGTAQAPTPVQVYATALLPADGAGVSTRRVEFGGRAWEVHLWPRAPLAQWGQLRMILVSGIAISVLLALLLWSQGVTQRRAIDLGRKMSVRFGESEARFRVLNEMLPALVLLAGAGDSRIVYANHAARTQLGQVVGMRLDALFADPALGLQALADVAGNGQWDSREAVVLNGIAAGLWVHAALAQVEVDAAPHLLMVATDTSAQREMTERLRYQASHDELTGLYNRREFEQQLRQALASRAGRLASAPFALMYIDLDQFKIINDLSGHMAGDQLLVQLTQAMRGNLRDNDVLARLGGDEFGLLVFDADLAQAHALAEQMRCCIERSTFLWQGRTYTVSASIGLVMVDRDGRTLKDLLAWADSACYLAKDDGRNRVRIHRDDDDATRRMGEMEWANRLRWALEQDRLLLDYQEVVQLDGARAPATHVELLLRMRDENGGLVMPGAFMGAAERYGLMPMVDRWVIRTALSNFSRLHPCGGQLATCAINLSGASIEDEGLADFILDTIERNAVPARQVCLEITETVAVRDLLRVVRMIERLRAAGCRIALDDFGAGMASFGYLKNLPVDIIKIDGGFVRSLDSDPMNRIIIDAVTRIGHQRGAKVVAEWVEDARCLEVLRSLGVDYAQGFFLHRPERVLFQREA